MAGCRARSGPQTRRPVPARCATLATVVPQVSAVPHPPRPGPERFPHRRCACQPTERRHTGVPWQDRHACRQGGEDNGQADQEDPAPARLDQQAAQHRATASGYRPTRSPYPTAPCPAERAGNTDSASPSEVGRRVAAPATWSARKAIAPADPGPPRTPTRHRTPPDRPGSSAADVVGGPPGQQRRRGQDEVRTRRGSTRPPTAPRERSATLQPEARCSTHRSSVTRN